MRMLPRIFAPVASIVFAILIRVVPVINDAPLIVADPMIGVSKVLLDKVSTASRVAITPVDGNVAVELMPVPPERVGSMPVIAAA